MLDSLVFADMKSRSVNLVHQTSGKGLELSFPWLEVLVVWTMPGKHAHYICLEPWHGMPGHICESGRFEDKRYATLLQPGECFQTGFTTMLID